MQLNGSMTIESNEQFTQLTSNWLNKFISDVATNKEKVLERVHEFPLAEKDIVRKAITEGPDKLDPNDTEAAKILFNFIEFYATGEITKIEVENAKR